MIINSQTRHARTNLSPTIEHLLRNYTGNTSSHRRGLRVTILYTSQFLGIPSAASDAVSQASVYAIATQLCLAVLLVNIGVASTTVAVITALDAIAGLLIWGTLRYARHRNLKSVRPIPRGQREVICIAPAGTSDAIVVVSEAGAAKLEDLAEGDAERPGPRRAHMICAPMFTIAMCLVMYGFSQLSVANAWCLVLVWAPGYAHAAYAARTWRSPSALGFQFAEKETRIVQTDKDLETLMEVENIERGAGLTLMHFFFPENHRSGEEV